MKCVNCFSYAINNSIHGRDGSDLNLCDVCYWRKRANPPVAPAPTPGNPKFLEYIDSMIAIQTGQGTLSEGYMRGLANGLILARSTFTGKEPEFIAPLPPVAPQKESVDQAREALEFGIKEMTHDIPGSCWSTGPLTGTAEDDLCRGCIFISKARAALLSNSPPTEGKG